MIQKFEPIGPKFYAIFGLPTLSFLLAELHTLKINEFQIWETLENCLLEDLLVAIDADLQLQV